MLRIIKKRVARRRVKQGKPHGGPYHGQHRGVVKKAVASLKKAVRWLVIRKETIGFIFLLVKIMVWLIRFLMTPK
jgi:hypothetical protein